MSWRDGRLLDNPQYREDCACPYCESMRKEGNVKGRTVAMIAIFKHETATAGVDTSEYQLMVMGRVVATTTDKRVALSALQNCLTNLDSYLEGMK